MSDEIVYMLEHIDLGVDFAMAAVFDDGTGDALGTQIANDLGAAMAEVLKNAITAHGVPDVVVMDNSPAATPSAEYCQRLGIRVRRQPVMPKN